MTRGDVDGARERMASGASRQPWSLGAFRRLATCDRECLMGYAEELRSLVRLVAGCSARLVCRIEARNPRGPVRVCVDPLGTPIPCAFDVFELNGQARIIWPPATSCGTTVDTRTGTSPRSQVPQTAPGQRPSRRTPRACTMFSRHRDSHVAAASTHAARWPQAGLTRTGRRRTLAYPPPSTRAPRHEVLPAQAGHTSPATRGHVRRRARANAPPRGRRSARARGWCRGYGRARGAARG